MSFTLCDETGYNQFNGDGDNDGSDQNASYSFTLPPPPPVGTTCLSPTPAIRIDDVDPSSDFFVTMTDSGRFDINENPDSDNPEENGQHSGCEHDGDNDDSEEDSVDANERLEKMQRLSGLFDFSPADMLHPGKRLSRASASSTVAVSVTLREPGDIRKFSNSSHPSECQDSGDEMTASFTFCPQATEEPEYTPPPPENVVNFEGKDLEMYERICTLGTGTFGRVFLIREKGTENYSALKMMAIRDIVETKQVQHVHSEKRILQTVKHPFIVKLHWTYKDSRYLYMNFDFVCGGELFAYLRNTGYFLTKTARFYCMETLLVLEYLHKRKIVFRDLKPENLLLAKDGHLVITDFGFAKKLSDRTWTLCGTPEYLAPEIISCKGHNLAVDYWALGVLMFEMLAGFPPFFGAGPLEIYDKILNEKPKFPRYFDLVAKDLCKKLLNKDRTKRLGAMKNGVEDAKKHKFFSGADWEAVFAKELKPPIMPKVYYPGDVGNFDEYEEDEHWDKIRHCKSGLLDMFANW